MIRARLENWIIQGHRISGEVYGDKAGEFKNETRIVTSSLSNIAFSSHFGAIAFTKNSVYQLGRQMNEGTIQASKEEGEHEQKL